MSNASRPRPGLGPAAGFVPGCFRISRDPDVSGSPGTIAAVTSKLAQGTSNVHEVDDVRA